MLSDDVTENITSAIEKLGDAEDYAATALGHAVVAEPESVHRLTVEMRKIGEARRTLLEVLDRPEETP